MKIRKIMIIAMLAVFLLAIASVSASDIDDSTISAEDTEIVLSGDSSIDELQTSEDERILTQNTSNELINAQDDASLLSDNPGTYSGLSEEIGTGGNIELQHDYYTYDSGDTIVINVANSVIDGKGAVIDMARSNIQAFYVNASGVTIKGLTIKNANYDGNGSAICFSSSATIYNCSFINNNASGYGGAIYFVGSSVMNILETNFNNNYASGGGGAIYFAGNYDGAIRDCNFINNSAIGNNETKTHGGAIYFGGELNGAIIEGCFRGNTAKNSGGAIYIKGKAQNTNFSSQFYENNATGASGGAICFSAMSESNTFESIFIDNYACYGAGIFFQSKANNNKIYSNFTHNIAKSCGGAMFFYNTTNNNNFTGNFINNSALGEINVAVGNGGAITFKDVSSNNIFNCDFINNTANKTGGGVNYRQNAINITFNANFIGNNVINGSGGGVNFFEHFENIIFNGEFIDNSAINGGAIAGGTGTVKDVSIKNNHAVNGGAIYFSGVGEVINCNFTNNRASENGGAIYFFTNSNIINSTFTNNSASDSGAVYFKEKAHVVNCNFTGNSAHSNNKGGGAIHAKSGTVAFSNFTDNSASNDGGAVYLSEPSDVVNCTFARNSAPKGGALFFYNTGNVTNCSFTNNKATGNGSGRGNGGALYFLGGIDGDENNVTNSYFANNSASNFGGAIYTTHDNGTTVDTCIFKTDSDTRSNTREPFAPTFNVDNFTKVYGSSDKLTFNLTTIKTQMPVSDGNISISVYVRDNDSFVGNYTCLSGEGWDADLPVGNYYAIFGTEYAGSQAVNRTINITMPDMQFYIIVTSCTTKNKTVNLTAKSNIPKDLIRDGKFLFILANGTQINAEYASNDTWWAVYEFDHWGEYIVSASYPGIDNLTVNNGTITVEKSDSTISIDKTVVNYGDSIKVATEGATGITAKINGADVAVTNYVIPTSTLNAGKYNLTVTTIADEVHNPITCNFTITVNQLKTQLIAKALTATYNANKYLVITLKDAKGNLLKGLKVTVVLKGTKTYTTNNKGQIKVPTKGLASKAYTAKIIFNGNVNYVKSTKNVKITIKKAANTLRVKAKAVKVKFSTLKKTALKLRVTKVVQFVNKGQGKKVFAKLKGNKNILINKKNGLVVIKKGLKRGTYKVQMRIRALGNANYKASAYKNIVFRIVVK